MNLIIFLAVLASPLISLAGASSPLCSEQKVSITGYYGDRGENPAELLDKWSEQSGDLIQLEVNKNDKLNSIRLQFLDEHKKVITNIDLPLKKNKTAPFRFIKLLNEGHPRPREVLVELHQAKDKIICHETIEIFNGRETGASEVKHDKK